MPVSRTAKQSALGSVRDRAATISPVGGELDRVGDQVAQDRAQLDAGRSRPAAGASSRSSAKRTGLSSSSRPRRALELARRARRCRSRCSVDVGDAGLELGVAEEVGDQLARGCGSPREIARSGSQRLVGQRAELAVEQQVGVAADDVERRAELVRAVRDQLALQALALAQVGDQAVRLEPDVDPEQQLARARRPCRGSPGCRARRASCAAASRRRSRSAG